MVSEAASGEPPPHEQLSCLARLSLAPPRAIYPVPAITSISTSNSMHNENLTVTMFPYILAFTLVFGFTIAHHAQTGQAAQVVDYIRIALFTYLGGILFDRLIGEMSDTDEEGFFMRDDNKRDV